MRGSEQDSFALCRCARIRQLNDQLRTTRAGGRIVMTRGVAALGPANVMLMARALREYEDFNPDNDPHGEHDMGEIIIAGETLLWKIDYYDTELKYRSADPADPAVTIRVLTVMLAEEY